MPPCIQMVFYAHLQHSLEVAQLDLTGNWKHQHLAPVNRFIPAQMDIASLLYPAFLWYQWSYLPLTIFHLKFNWTLLNTVCTSVPCVQVWRWHGHWELAWTVRERVPSRPVCVRCSLCWCGRAQCSTRAQLTDCWSLLSAPCRAQTPGSLGNSAGRRASWGGEQALVLCSVCLGGETCKWSINHLLHPVIWTNLKKKWKKSGLDSRYSLPRWFVSATKGGGSGKAWTSICFSWLSSDPWI